jgi:hypothetical protein
LQLSSVTMLVKPIESPVMKIIGCGESDVSAGGTFNAARAAGVVGGADSGPAQCVRLARVFR